MAQRRKSIASLMILVAIVAINVCIARLVFWYEPWRLAGIGPIAVAIQVGLYFLFRSRGRPRRYAFWVGFDLGGLLGLCSFLYARVPDSALGAIWENYAEFIDDLLSVQLGVSFLNRNPFDPILLTVIAVFGSLPQFLMAMIGGVLGLCLGWSRQVRILMIKLVVIGTVIYGLSLLL